MGDSWQLPLTGIMVFSRPIGIVLMMASSAAWVWAAYRRGSGTARPQAILASVLTSVAVFVWFLPYAADRALERYVAFVDAQAKLVQVGSLCDDFPKQIHGYWEYDIEHGDAVERRIAGAPPFIEKLNKWQKRGEVRSVVFKPDGFAGVSGNILSDFPAIEIRCGKDGRVVSVSRLGA